MAIGQFLLDARRKCKPFWRTFWQGDAMEGGSEDTSKGLLGSRNKKLVEATRGVTYPMTLWVSIAIGSPLAVWNGVICGVLLIGLTIPRGPIKATYAGWNRYVV